jgi:hypothetical protein
LIGGWPGVSANDATEAVAWRFLSLEAAIVSVADKHGLDTQRQHWKKAEVAEELHARGVLPHDFSDILRLLNEGRKVATYVLEDLAGDVETAVELPSGRQPHDHGDWHAGSPRAQRPRVGEAPQRRPRADRTSAA